MDSIGHQLAEHIEVPYLLETIAFLLSVVIVVPLFKRIKLSPIVGYLIIGAIIGPHNTRLIQDSSGIQHFAELGVIFLLFTIGLELSFERLRAFSGLIFGLGSLQVISCAGVIGGTAYFWGNSAQAAIIIGLCLALSSTAMVVQLLTERGEISTKYGRASFAVLLFQDLAVVPILILIGIFGANNNSSIIVDVGLAFAKAGVAIGFIVVLGRFGLRKVFHIAANTQSIDVFTAMTLLTILAISVATGLSGLSMALGAFLAGLLLAETEFRHQIEGEIEPFKGLFLGLFFMSVGMNIDFALAFDKKFWVIASVIGLIGLKAAVTFIAAKLCKIKTADAIRSALILAEGGEFAFVVIGQASLNYSIIPIDVGQFMVVVAGLSMMLTPALVFLGHQLAKPFQQNASNEKEIIDEDIHDHIVIAGYGRVGKLVAEVLRNEAIPYIAIDQDAEKIKPYKDAHEPVYAGDASRVEFLKRTSIKRAAALLITMNNPKMAMRTLHVARQHWPDLHIIVRAQDTEHSEALIQAGATQVVPETLEASFQLSNYVLRCTGLSREAASACVDSLRKAKFEKYVIL